MNDRQWQPWKWCDNNQEVLLQSHNVSKIEVHTFGQVKDKWPISKLSINRGQNLGLIYIYFVCILLKVFNFNKY